MHNINMINKYKLLYKILSYNDIYNIELKNISKSLDLFLHRGIIKEAQLELLHENFEDWFISSLRVQSSIYNIDTLYENEITIDFKVENPMWGRVIENINQIDGFNNAEIGKAFEDLQKYADVERRIHVFDLIDTKEFESILSLKCSDVRIARSLIMNFANKRYGKNERIFWLLYDQCWELIEDLQDIEEDGKDWNFNFWLYSYMAGNSTIGGIDAVEKLLECKAILLEKTFDILPNNVDAIFKIAFSHTIEAIHYVKNNLHKVVDYIQKGKIIQFGKNI